MAEKVALEEQSLSATTVYDNVCTKLQFMLNYIMWLYVSVD